MYKENEVRALAKMVEKYENSYTGKFVLDQENYKKLKKAKEFAYQMVRSNHGRIILEDFKQKSMHNGIVFEVPYFDSVLNDMKKFKEIVNTVDVLSITSTNDKVRFDLTVHYVWRREKIESN